MHLPEQILLACGCLLLLWAALHDVATRTVPDTASVLIAMLGLAGRIQAGETVAGLLAAAAVFVAGALVWHRGWLGGGDVKLLAAVALLMAPMQVPGFLAATSIAGGVLAIVYLAIGFVLRRRAASLMRHDGARRAGWLARVYAVERWRIRRSAALPYASAIATGAGLSLWQG